MSCGSSVKSLKNGVITNPNIANTIADSKSRHKPLLAPLLAASVFPSPSLRYIYEFMPTDVPIATAIINICIG